MTQLYQKRKWDVIKLHKEIFSLNTICFGLQNIKFTRTSECAPLTMDTNRWMCAFNNGQCAVNALLITTCSIRLWYLKETVYNFTSIDSKHSLLKKKTTHEKYHSWKIPLMKNTTHEKDYSWKRPLMKNTTRD